MTQRTLFDLWSTLMGNTFGNDAPLLIAYTLAAAHRQALLAVSNGFPLLLVQGHRAAGKSVAARSVVAPLTTNACDRWDGFNMDGRLLRPLNNYLQQGSPIVWLNDYKRRQPKRVEKENRIAPLYHTPTLPAAVVCCSSWADVPNSLDECGIDVHIDATNRPEHCAWHLQKLQAFELQHGNWLQTDAYVAHDVQRQYPATLAHLEACWDHYGWQKHPRRDRQLNHLAMLYAVVESWVAMGYPISFSPDDLATCYVRHNPPYAHHQA